MIIYSTKQLARASSSLTVACLTTFTTHPNNSIKPVLRWLSRKCASLMIPPFSFSTHAFRLRRTWQPSTIRWPSLSALVSLFASYSQSASNPCMKAARSSNLSGICPQSLPVIMPSSSPSSLMILPKATIGGRLTSIEPLAVPSSKVRPQLSPSRST